MRQGSPTSNNPALCTLCFDACPLNIQHTSRESSLCYTHVSLTFKLSKLSIIISLETVSREIGMRLAHRHRSTVGCRVHACASRYRNLDYSSRGLMEVKSYPCALPTYQFILDFLSCEWTGKSWGVKKQCTVQLLSVPYHLGHFMCLSYLQYISGDTSPLKFTGDCTVMAFLKSGHLREDSLRSTYDASVYKHSI